MTAQFTILQQIRLSHFVRVLTVMKMAQKYTSMLKLGLAENPFEMSRVETSILSYVIMDEQEAFLRRHAPIPTAKGVLKQPKWAKNVSEDLDESWEQFSEGLITWTEFLNSYLYEFSENNRADISKWDMGNNSNPIL